MIIIDNGIMSKNSFQHLIKGISDQIMESPLIFTKKISFRIKSIRINKQIKRKKKTSNNEQERGSRIFSFFFSSFFCVLYVLRSFESLKMNSLVIFIYCFSTNLGLLNHLKRWQFMQKLYYSYVCVVDTRSYDGSLSNSIWFFIFFYCQIPSILYQIIRKSISKTLQVIGTENIFFSFLTHKFITNLRRKNSIKIYDGANWLYRYMCIPIL